MPYVSREFKSSDTNAPALSGRTPGSVIQVLKAVLVNGYGDKTALGWDLMYEDIDNHICVFRPKTGSRMFLQIIDDGKTDAQYAFAYSWESMFDVASGVHKMPTSNSTAAIFKTARTSGTAESSWSIIGDEVGFYFLIQPNIQGAANVRLRRSIMYVGEGIVLGDTSFTTPYNWLQMTAQTNYYYPQPHFMRNPKTQTAGYMTQNSDWWCSVTTEGEITRSGIQTNGTIAGVIGYEPVYLKFYDYNTYEINTPGMFVPILPVPSHQYRLGEEWYEEIDKKNKLFCFPVLGQRYTNANEEYRAAILIGDRFRHVF